MEHPQAPACCEGPVKSTLPFGTLCRGSWASVVSGITHSSASYDMDQCSTLADQSKLLQVLVALVGSFLERVEDALVKLSLGPTPLATIVTPCSPVVSCVGSMKDVRTELFDCFSPRVGVSSSSLYALPLVLTTPVGEAIVMVGDPVLQVMPELQQLCARPASPLSVEHMEVVSLAISCEGHDSPMSCEQLEVPESIVSVVPVGDFVVSVVSMADDIVAVGMLAPELLEPSQPLAFVDIEGSDVAVTHSHVTIGKVVYVHDKIDEILFKVEVHNLLKCLEASYRGSGKTIVEEALMKSKSKKNGGAGKASAAA
ncbi:Heat shock 70 kDa protein 4L [Hordeum vulgare]|nr:Heat shock 70 kDa protein 4L [Hordeum vulgare]